MSHPYAEFLTRVSKPARYVGGEVNQRVKSWRDVELRFALAFPDVYDVGMSHLGMKILYTLLNRDERIACERVFAPWPDLERELRARGLELVSLESRRPLRDFDVVGFSLQYELTYTNVLLMLELGGIPLRGARRGEDDPLVIAGGPTATHPEPLADFIDAFLIGDAEDKLPELLLAWRRARASGLARAAALAALARLGGVYVPSLYQRRPEPLTGLEVVDPAEGSDAPFPVRRAFLADIDRHPFPDDAPVPHAEAIFDRMAVEIARGCTEGCRFCQAGMIYRPVRERSPQSVLETVRGSLVRGGYDEVSLTSLSTADYSAVAPLVERVAAELTPRKVALSVSSLRAYGLPEPVLDDISRVRASGLTFAPEAGTQRMRDVISKNISDEDMIQTAHRVFGRGWDRMKLYFMMGLPTETDEDVRGIAETAARVAAVGLEYHPRRRLRLSVSISPHVPKPHTPFQWAAFDGPAELERKRAMLSELGRGQPFELKGHEPSASALEALLSRGDRRLGDVIETAYRLGARFDGWEECFRSELWEQALAEHGIERERYWATLPVDARLPWDHIDVGLAEGFLLKEYRKALRDRLSPPCGKPFRANVHHTNLAEALADQRKLICYDCGVACDLGQMRAERLSFLDGLGALQPRAPQPPARRAGTGRRARGRPPQPGFEQGRRFDLRVGFTKLETAALEGHLDFMRSLLRSVRRAGLEPYYSLGFRPKPVLVLGPALSLGIPSLSEYADLALARPYAVEEVLERLNRAAPGGVRFWGARALEPGERRLGKLTSLAEYLAVIEAETYRCLLHELGAPPRQEADLLATRLDAAPAIADRRGRARPLAAGVAAVWPAHGDPRVQELGLARGEAVLGLRLPTDSGIRPAELVGAVLGRPVALLGVGRVALLGQVEGGLAAPLELDGRRSPPEGVAVSVQAH